MRHALAADQPRAQRARAVSFESGGGGGANLRMPVQPQVVVIGEAHQRAAPARGAIGDRVDRQEPGVMAIRYRLALEAKAPIGIGAQGHLTIHLASRRSGGLSNRGGHAAPILSDTLRMAIG